MLFNSSINYICSYTWIITLILSALATVVFALSKIYEVGGYIGKKKPVRRIREEIVLDAYKNVYRAVYSLAVVVFVLGVTMYGMVIFG